MGRQQRSGSLDDTDKQVDTKRKICRDDDADPGVRNDLSHRSLVLIPSGRADHRVEARRSEPGEVVHRGVGGGEVNGHVGGREPIDVESFASRVVEDIETLHDRAVVGVGQSVDFLAHPAVSDNDDAEVHVTL